MTESSHPFLQDDSGRPVILRPPMHVTATAEQGCIRLAWIHPRDLDYHYTEVFASRIDDRTTATYLAPCFYDGLYHVGLGINEVWFYWLRSRYRGYGPSEEVTVSATTTALVP
jgi:predicted phage tail protein